ERGRRVLRAGAWEPAHGDAGRIALEPERPVAGAEELHELVVDDLHDLLAGREAAQDLRADGLLAAPRDDVFHDLEVDVGVEEGQSDLARGGIDVGLADAAAAG